MATLSLKKPVRTAVLIEKRPIQDLFGKFAVMRQNPEAKKMRFTCTHETYDEAKAEAFRLAIKFPGCRFMILEVVGAAEV